MVSGDGFSVEGLGGSYYIVISRLGRKSFTRGFSFSLGEK